MRVAMSINSETQGSVQLEGNRGGGMQEAPIHQEVYAMLYEGKPARQAMGDLLSREARKEDD